MAKQNLHNGWSRIAPGIDVELQHGIPVRIANHSTGQQLDEQHIANRVYELTGLTISVSSWINVTPDERESTVCIDMKEFDEVLTRLAMSSAAIYIDRFHHAIGSNAEEWINEEYSFDFNQAIERCCIPWGTINKSDYYGHYSELLRSETTRLISEGISPLVETEQMYS